MTAEFSVKRRLYLFMLLSLAMVIPLFKVALYAQATGATLTGTVRDTSHAVVPNAAIEIRNTATGEVRNVTSNSDGAYSAPNLLPGSYEVTITAAGFSKEIRTGITLTVGQQQELDLTLQVGQVTQSVEVTGEAPTINLVNATLGNIVESTTVTELPLNGRDWSQLATLQPGVNSVASLQGNPQTQSSERIIRGVGSQMSIGGTRAEQNNYRVDGITINDYVDSPPGNVLGLLPGVDAISEFTVLTSVYGAQYGRSSGGILEAVTRAGTNQIHGSAFEFIRNSALDARNFFDPAQIPEFRRNQFGASFGGPIQKDKTFFFANYEGLRQDLGVSVLDTVPSATMRMGILHDSTGTAVNVGVNPAIAPFLPFWPLPNAGLIGFGDTGLYSASQSQPGTDNFGDGRLDQTFSSKDHLSATFQYEGAHLTINGDALGGTFANRTTGRDLLSLQETHVFNAGWVNSLRAGYARAVVEGGTIDSATNPLASDAALASIPGFHADAFNVGGLTYFGGGIGTGNNDAHYYNSFQVYDDVFLTKGKHSFKFGGSIERDQDNMFLTAGAGAVTFKSLTTFLLDEPQKYTAVANATTLGPRDWRDSIFGLYAQDDIRLRPNLTVNLGLRWEMSTVPTEVDGRLAHIATITSPTIILGSPLWRNPTYRNFEPRAGFAWDPFGNGKASIRGGFGMYDILPTAYLLGNGGDQDAPFYLSGRTNNPPAGDFPSTVFSLLTPNTFRTEFYDPARNYVMQWNLTAQYEIIPDLTVTLGYVGSTGDHMIERMGDGDVTLPTITSAGALWPADASSSTRINPNFGRIDTYNWGGKAYYDALQLGVVKRMSHGFQVQGSYTWGRAIDTSSGGIVPDTLANGLDPDSFDPMLSRGVSDFDVQENLTISFTWVIPTPSSLHGAASWALGGWQLGTIFTARTGEPFTPQIEPDPLGEGNSSAQDWPSRVQGCKLANSGNVQDYINLNCFTLPMQTPAIASQCVPFVSATTSLPLAGTCANLLGNSSRNVMFGPGSAEEDFSLFKNFKIKERFNAQFRVETFNVFNRANFNAPLDNLYVFDGNGAPVPGAGLLDTTSTTSRQIQFGLKLTW